MGRQTQFKQRRLPRVGQIIHDLIAEEDVYVRQVRTDALPHRIYVSRGGAGVYARSPRYFDWEEN